MGNARTIRDQTYRLGGKLAAVSAALVSAAVLVPSAAAATEPPSSLEEIYAALRPENLRTSTGRTAFSPGEFVDFSYELVNTSEEPLVIPLDHSFSRPFHLVGTAQGWVERLGPDPTIPGIPPFIARKGNWYAAGGGIIAVEGLPDDTIPPAGRVARQAGLFTPTAGFPTGRYRFHLEYKPLSGGLFDVIATVSLDLTFGPVDTTPPVLTMPGGITAEATAHDGVAVLWEASATDATDGAMPVTCAPPSGSTFPIGTTTVTCSATDAAGNEASASFDLHVKGAEEQLDELIQSVADLGSGTSLADKLGAARAALDAGERTEACSKLTGFVNEVRAQSGKKLTTAQAEALIAAAVRIRAVLGC